MLNGLPMDSHVALINQGDGCLSKYKYVVPAYQRPYSWGEEQIDDFLKTIMEGFNDDINKFFGTMQFVIKDSGYEIVDGQQRLTTMKLFLYVLSGLSGDCYLDFDISYNNMENANECINVLMAQNIDEILRLSKDKQGNTDISDVYNTFEANICMLKDKILSWHKDDTKKRELKQYADDLYAYFCSKIYVVILETDKSISLPEVVSIFNTINTTGMDLNSADIFKFQYYDYLCKNTECVDAIGNDDYWMDKINGCYKQIENYNLDKPIKKHISMSDVLTIYQHCLCARYEKNFKILAKSSERFFDDVFKEPLKYKELLSFEKFSQLVRDFIEFISELDENRVTSNSMHALSIRLIKETRYPRYWTIPYVYVFFNGNSQETKEKAMEVGYKVFSYLVVHSMNYAKMINPVHTEMCNEILPLIAEGKDITEAIIQRQWRDPYDNNDKNERAKEYFKTRLTKDAIANGKAGTFCLLIGLFYERNRPLDELKDKFFSWEAHPYDIEHIYSHDSFTSDSKFDDESKAIFNGIGNLIILDQKINRDMGRKLILLPKDKYSHREKYYEKSVYKIVKDFTPKLLEWDLSGVKERAEEQLDLLINEILKVE